MHWTNEKTLIFHVSQHQGPSLIFGTLPKVFGALTGGPVFAVAFFVLILFAAVTSAIALLEVVVSYVVVRWGWPRRRAVLVMGFLIFLLGIPSSLSFGPLADFKIAGYNFFDFVGVLTDNILLPVGGILMCWFWGWKWDLSKLADEMEDGCPGFRYRRIWISCIRYLTPILVLIVTITGFVSIYQTVFGG